jgi:hypothetical protein
MHARRVRALLMGGQACVFYGAAEFSRAVDFAILADATNLARLRRALADLQAEVIAVPAFTVANLRRGFAIQFRCQHPEAEQLRVDVMSRMRGVDSFAKLWKRRTRIQLTSGETCDLLSLPDLVQAKKTQRDKDWPMIRRLLEAHYFQNHVLGSVAQKKFWLAEMRTPELLIEIAQQNMQLARRMNSKRPLLALAILGRADELTTSLSTEESSVREKDRTYWKPLFRELERLRHAQISKH